MNDPRAAGSVSAQQDRKPDDPRPPPYPQRGPLMPDEEEFALDPATIKVLASDTRMALLRLLRERRMTLTELAQQTKLHKATVLEHLERMTAAGLVKRHDDPERIWVYYELTRRGDRLVNPGRTRFFLLMGAAALAGVVVIALLASMSAPPPAPSGSQDDMRGRLAFALAEHDTYSSEVALRAIPEGPGAAPPVAALLLPASVADHVVDGGPGRGYRLVIEAQNDTVTLRAAEVPPGDYRLFLRDAAGRDNRLAMPRVHVANLTAGPSHPVWWQGFDDAARFQVTRDGAPVEGNLTLQAEGAPAPALALPLVAGQAQASPEALDPLAPGVYRVHVARPGEAPVQAGSMTVRAPQVAVTPLQVLAGASTPVRVTVALGPESAPDPVVVGEATLQRTGASTYALTPAGPQALALRIGRLLEVPVEAHPYVAVAAAALPGPQLELTLRDQAGRPWANATVALDGAVLGATNASGQLAFPMPAEGPRVFAFGLPGGAEVARAVRVAGWTVQEAAPALALNATAAGTADGAAVDVSLDNAHASAVPLTLRASVDGVPAAAVPLEVPAAGRATAQVRLATAPGNRIIAVDVETLAQPPLSYANRTAPPSPPSPPPPGAPPSASTPTSPTSPTPPSSGGAAGGAGDTASFDRMSFRSAPLLVAAATGLLGGGEAESARLEAVAPSLAGELGRKDSAAKTPAFEAPLLLAAVALALLAARRRR